MTSTNEYQQALRVVEHVYDAALEPGLWPRALRESIAFVGGSKGLLFTPLTNPKDGGFVIPDSIPQSTIEQWEARYLPQDVWAQAGARKGVFHDGNVVLDRELVPEPEFFQSVAYREFFGPVGIARLCCGIVFGRPTGGLLPTVCSVFRNSKEPSFGESERRKLRMLLPHLSRAFGVTYRLRDAEFKVATTLSALDRIRTGVILIDGDGGVIQVNAAARRSLQESDGLALRARLAGAGGDRLSAADHRAQQRIDQAIKACIALDVLEVPHFAKGVRVPRPSGLRDYMLQFAPLPVSNSFAGGNGSPRLIAFLTDAEAPIRLDAALLKRLFELTPAETALAERLLAGETLVEAASARGVSEATARTHLRHIFEKTSTRRQGDLARLLYSLHSLE